MKEKSKSKETDKVFVKKVLDFYNAEGRHDLIWRKKINAYRILVSEIMLQQTQVVRVTPKFNAWMKECPTLKKLATASFSDILKLWQGLGYQRRAKALFELSRTINALPKTYEGLIGLKGIGPYTASAIMAFAYDTFPPHLLETNIRTALIEEFHKRKKSIPDNLLYDDLARLNENTQVVKVGARNFYYALMDYGAYLKASKISHNEKSSHYAKQSPYKGSVRELRAKIVFAVAHNKTLPKDERTKEILAKLVTEGYIVKKGRSYSIAS